MTTKTKPLKVFTQSGVSERSVRCPRCKVVQVQFVNRGGRLYARGICGLVESKGFVCEVCKYNKIWVVRE